MIVARGLRKVFPNGHVALEEVSLTVEAGEFVCVIGRSGAGKSTLLRCLNGALEVTAGTVSVDGVEVSSASAEARCSRLPQRSTDPRQPRNTRPARPPRTISIPQRRAQAVTGNLGIVSSLSFVTIRTGPDRTSSSRPRAPSRHPPRPS